MNKALAIAAKDLRIEARGREIALPMVMFGVTLVFLFALVLPPGSGRARPPAPQAGAVPVREIAGALLWASLLFAGVLGFSRHAASEREDARLDALLMAPVDPAAVFAGKTIAGFAFLCITEAVVLPAFAVMLNLEVLGLIPGLVAVALPANLGLAAAGALFGAAAQYSRAREVVLPLLLFPVVLPVMLAAIALTSALLAHGSFAGEGRWFILMASFDLAIPVAGAAAYEYVIRE